MGSNSITWKYQKGSPASFTLTDAGVSGVDINLAINSTLTDTGSVIGINLANANTWTGAQDFSAGATGTTFSASTSITTPISLNSAAQTTVTGTTAGSLICSQPEQGTSYKKVIVYADGYENDSTTAQTYTFPTAFTAVAVITTNSAAIPVTTTSLTALSTAPDTTTAYTGLIVIEGY